MAELEPNPDGCAKFEPNPFKKEKCKGCGHPWHMHQGVISQDIVNHHAQIKQRAEEERLQKEAEAKAAARAKKLAKRRSSQAVEDDWYLDGSKEDPNKVLEEDSEDDDDGGFRMFDQDDLARAPIERLAASAPVGSFKVKNLIDFGECDVAHEPPFPPELPPAGVGGSSSSSCPPIPGQTEAEMVLAAEGPGAAPTRSLALGIRPGPPSAGPYGLATPAKQVDKEVEELHEEIEQLRQMLADANEEKNIQVAIIQDEIVEKQQVIEDLTRQKAEVEAKLQDANTKIENAAPLLSQRVEALAHLEQERLQVDRLRAELEQLKAQATGAPAAEVSPGQGPTGVLPEVVSQRDQALVQLEQERQQVERLQTELQKIKAEVASGATDANPGPAAATVAAEAAELQQARTDVAQLRLELEQVTEKAQAQLVEERAVAEHLRAEVEQLKALAKPAPAEEQPGPPALATSPKVEAQLQQAHADAEQLRSQLEKLKAEAQMELAQERAKAEKLQIELEQLKERSTVESHEALLVADSQTTVPGEVGDRTLTSTDSEVRGAVRELACELRHLCGCTLRALLDVSGGQDVPKVDTVATCFPTASGLEAELANIKSTVLQARAAAERIAVDRRHLAWKLQEAEQAAAKVQGAAHPSVSFLPRRLGVGASRRAEADGRHAAQVLRQMRQNAERHLAWIHSQTGTVFQAVACASGQEQQ